MHRAMMRLAGFGLNCQTARAPGACPIRALKESAWRWHIHANMNPRRRDLAARCARVLVLVLAPSFERARGTPDAWCVRSLMREVNKRTS